MRVQDIRALGLGHSGDTFHSQLVICVAPAVRLRAIGAAASHAGNHPRPQLEQAVEITAIQGQRVDLAIADCPAQSGVGSVDRRDLSSDRNRLRLLARLHHQIHTNILSHLYQHAAVLHGLKALGRGFHRVRARCHIVRYILPGAVGGQRSRDAASHVDHTHRSACNGASGLVKNSALDRSLAGLGKRGRHKRKETRPTPSH